MATRYWVGNSGNYNDTAHWSASSGGAGGASVPASADDVTVDANSFSANGHTITVPFGYSAYAASFSASSANDSFTLHIADTAFFAPSQNVTLSSFMTLTQAGSGFMAVFSLNGDKQINFNGATINSNVSFEYRPGNTGTWYLNSAITMGTGAMLTLRDNTLNTNNYNIDVDRLNLLAGTFVPGTSTISVARLTINPGVVANFTDTVMHSYDHGLYRFVYGSGRTYKEFHIHDAREFYFYHSNSMELLHIDPGGNVYFQPGVTNYFDELDATGTSSDLIFMGSETSGQRAQLGSSSEYIIGDYLELSDLEATGATQWYAGENSQDLGNNLNWIFTAPAYNFDVLSGATGGGVATPYYEYAGFTVTSVTNGIGRAIYSTNYRPLPEKDYEYRVFDKDWNFIGIWQDVEPGFEYSQTINQNASELMVNISRAPDNRIVKYDPLLDDVGSPILDNNSDPIYLQTETENSVGEGTDVDINLNVDVYAFYGGYENLTDEEGEDVLDENSDPILVQYGNPNGKRVYSGYIVDYELIYGDRTGVRVQIVPHATEMDHYIFKGALGNTTVEYANSDPVLMARDAMDSYNNQGGIITYDTSSMPLSGFTSPYPFKLQTTREVVDKTVELLPSGFYHFVDPGERKQYLLEKASTAHHTFWYEKHITELRLKKSISQLVNKLYFIGGEHDPIGQPGEDLFKYYEDPTSITNIRPGLDRITDSRVKLEGSADAIGESKVNQYKVARYRTSVEITDATYDIESIRLGQEVSFKNFGTDVDNLILQIVTINRKVHSVILDLDMVVPSDTKRLIELKRDLRNQEIRSIPDAPL